MQLTRLAKVLWVQLYVVSQNRVSFCEVRIALVLHVREQATPTHSKESVLLDACDEANNMSVK